MTSPHVLRLQASEDTTTKSWRFKSGLLHCFSPFVTFVRQCGNSRDQCGRTAAHRPTHFCKNAGPIILPEANLVLPPTEGVASCGEESWVVYALREAQQKKWLSAWCHRSTIAPKPTSSKESPAQATAPGKASTTTPTRRLTEGNGIPSERTSPGNAQQARGTKLGSQSVHSRDARDGRVALKVC